MALTVFLTLASFALSTCELQPTMGVIRDASPIYRLPPGETPKRVEPWKPPQPRRDSK